MNEYTLQSLALCSSLGAKQKTKSPETVTRAQLRVPGPNHQLASPSRWGNGVPKWRQTVKVRKSRHYQVLASSLIAQRKPMRRSSWRAPWPSTTQPCLHAQTRRLINLNTTTQDACQPWACAHNYQVSNLCWPPQESTLRQGVSSAMSKLTQDHFIICFITSQDIASVLLCVGSGFQSYPQSKWMGKHSQGTSPHATANKSRPQINPATHYFLPPLFRETPAVPPYYSTRQLHVPRHNKHTPLCPPAIKRTCTRPCCTALVLLNGCRGTA